MNISHVKLYVVNGKWLLFVLGNVLSLLIEKILHHLGCPKCSFYPSIKTFSGILNVFIFLSINRISPKQTCPGRKKQCQPSSNCFPAKFPVSHFRHRNQWLQHAAECLLRMLGCLSFGVNWGCWVNALCQLCHGSFDALKNAWTTSHALPWKMKSKTLPVLEIMYSP